MDLVNIRTFCRAVEEGNLTAAAKALHITKSVASRRIQALEDSLNVRLLNRTTRGVNPTDAGALFYERGIKILADVDDASQSVKSAGDKLAGQLRITAPRSFSDLDFQEPLMAFAAKHPDLSFDVNLTDQRVDVIGGGYDLALRIASDLADTSLIAKKLMAVRSLVVASPNYLQTNGTPQSPEDLKDHNCVFYANVAASEQWRFAGINGLQAVRVKGSITTNSGVMQLAAATSGIAIATLPMFFLRDALEKGDIVPILENWQRPDSYLYALYPERRLLPVKVRVLLDFLTEWYKDPAHQQGL
jgi:DNA-binding transcriptional LysR family regulator